MTIADYVKAILKKAGSNPEDDRFKDFFGNEALSKVDVPDDLSRETDTNLISITEAKNNNGPLKNHYTALALNGIDSQIDQLLEELGLTDDDRNEFKIEKSTGKKVNLLVKKAQALEVKKANANKPDATAIQKQIDGLHLEIRTEKAKAEQAISDYKKAEKVLRLGYDVSSRLAKHKTIHDNLDAETKNTIIKTLIDIELKNKNAHYDYDDNGTLVLLRNDGTNYFGENNTTVSPDQFIEQVLSSKKLLTVKDGNNSTNGHNANTPPNGSQSLINNGGNNTANERKNVGQSPIFQELLEQSRTDFNNVNGVRVNP
jgi:hypothetical protein